VSDALAAVPDRRRGVYLRALAALAAADMIVPQQEGANRRDRDQR